MGILRFANHTKKFNEAVKRDTNNITNICKKTHH